MYLASISPTIGAVLEVRVPATLKATFDGVFVFTSNAYDENGKSFPRRSFDDLPRSCVINEQQISKNNCTTDLPRRRHGLRKRHFFQGVRKYGQIRCSECHVYEECPFSTNSSPEQRKPASRQLLSCSQAQPKLQMVLVSSRAVSVSQAKQKRLQRSSRAFSVRSS